jgi:Protein of unknown function (DUF1579)
MMMRRICAIAVAGLVAVPAARAQEFPPKPGPEHELLKKMEGTWEATTKAGGMESKGTMTYKMALGGLWLMSKFEGEFAGQKFEGHGMDTYDTMKKKFVGIWADSMSTSPLVMEGTYDKAKKTQTMTGEGPGMDGKPARYKTVTEMKDDDNMVFHLYMGDAKEPMMTITYKRKK